MSEENEKDATGEEVETQRVHETPGSYYAPLVDIYETDDVIIVEADMPGVDRTDVDVKIETGVLSIVGRAKRKPVRDMTQLYEEFVPGDYYRAFAVGEEIDESRISAVAENGVLTVTLPKAERSRVRKIDVK